MMLKCSNTRSKNQLVIIFVFIIIFLSLAVYRPVTGFDFLSYDDDLNIYNNPYLKSPILENISAFWIKPYELLYIPMTYTFWSYIAAMSLFFSKGSLNPGYFHTANLIVHIINTLLIFSILKMILENAAHRNRFSFSYIPAVCGALFFSLHPINVESVAWITGMKELLSGFFAFLSICLYLKFTNYLKNDTAVVKRNIIYIVSLIAYLLGLLAKPTTIMVPLIILILVPILTCDKFINSLKCHFLKLLPFFAIAFFFAVLTIKVMPLPATKTLDLSWQLRPFVACDALLFYIYKLCIPIHFTIDYGRIPANILSEGITYTTPFIVFGLILLIGLFKQKYIGYTILGLITAGVLPVLGLAPFEFQRISTVADRYFYLSMLGAGFAFSVIMSRVPPKFFAVFFMIIIVLGIRSMLQVHTWKDTKTLMKHTYAVNPDSHIANLNIGNAFLRTGRFKEALFYLKKAAVLRPDHPYSLYNLGLAYVGLHDKASAMRCYRLLKPVFPQWAAKLDRYISLLTGKQQYNFKFQ